MLRLQVQSLLLRRFDREETVRFIEKIRKNVIILRGHGYIISVSIFLIFYKFFNKNLKNCAQTQCLCGFVINLTNMRNFGKILS